ncbi:hypothetical protein N7494_006955 [Penicillium frequentans]|uniref:Uncharacterized protein n=1 Tax=Penicillium frequentans TaxID=3151616 RepID=A0AAD6GEA6_9EURO|nr:hypothetical protein N7494_006955 [Penicillium glabrum]
MLADTCMKNSGIKSSLRYNASVDTRQPTPVITDITRDVTSPEDGSHPTSWPVFEPYPTPTRINPTPSDIVSQLLHAELDYVKSLTGARTPIEDGSAMALPDVTVMSMTQEIGSGPGGGVTDFSSHVAATNGSASWSMDTVNQSISFAVETVHTNQDAMETLAVPTSRATSRLSPADSEHTSTEASTRYDEPTEAKNGSPENQLLRPDELPIRILVVLFLILYNKPGSPSNTPEDDTEPSLLPGRTVIHKSSLRQLRYSDHRMAQQDLRWKLLARQQFAQKQRDAERKGLISPNERPADMGPILNRLGCLKKGSGSKLKRACQLLHCGSRHLSRMLLSVDPPLQKLGTDPNIRSQIALKAPAAFAEQTNSLGAVALRWLAGKLSEASTERTTMEFWRLATLVAQHYAASKA